jgi:hypothetical protein
MEDNDINLGISDSEDTFTLDYDLGDIPALTTADIQPLTVGNIDLTSFANMATITLNGSSGTGWTTGPTIYTIGAGGGGGAGSYNYSNTWQSQVAQPSLKVQGDADIEGNLKVNGVNISDILATIQDRLSILVPDPARLEKYEALRLAYEHYKTLEALCIEESNPPEKK